MSDQQRLPTLDPEVTEESRPFWEAAARGELHLPRCNACGTVIWYPRQICPDCHAREISWFRASGRGSVYTFTVVHRSLGEFADVTPYVVAYVELEEGPRILTNIVGCDPLAVEVGMPVEVEFQRTASGGALHRFRPRTAASGDPA